MVVAIGGSAGALEAVRGLIAGLPARSGIAYILVQHLDPDHRSMLADLLVDATPFPVVEITDGMALLPDRLHVIPAGARVAVRGGALRLSASPSHRGPRLPVDHLLLSLARQPGLRVVAVLLSGNGADGSQGVRAIHLAGGYVIAQDPNEAGHDSMPASAIATGCVDAILPVALIGSAIIDRRNRLPLPVPPNDGDLGPVLARLKRSGHDFSGYKLGTMRRRIQRRARLAGHGNGPTALGAYADRLDDDEAEVQMLANDLLINVTGFFRDHEVFAALAGRIVPELVLSHQGDRPIRVWSAGCSSGEEAWSLAMLLLEEIARSRSSLKLQLFATDLDPDAIATARRGIYPASIASDISAERLQRFFIPDDAGWHVGRALQASVVFAVHDLLTDPPFSRMDLISCRNLLIYLQPAAQARAISLFHFALRPGGLLLLGTSEAVPDAADGTAPAFTLIASDANVYRRTAARKAPPAIVAEQATAWGGGSPARPAPPWPLPSLPSARLLALEAELASIRAELANADHHRDASDPEQGIIHADTLSRNQEYQSANEELITSQEELQSLNEELVALNGQLQETIDRQRTMADDLQNILYSTNVATIFLDTGSHIRFFTPATRLLFNMLPADIGRPLADLAPLAPDPTLASDIAAMQAGQQPPDREVQTADGIWFSRQVLPYRAHDDRPEGVVITYVDVTARRRAELVVLDAREAAETANLAKSRFLAAASHDLRQPLQSLVLLQELLARRAADPDSRLLLDRLEHTLDAMTTMLDGLLDINRIEAGALDIQPGPFALDALLAETVQGLVVQAAAGGLRLRHVRTGCHVVSDRRLLAGMVRNLVANALKYTIRGGVLVGARRRGSTVRIEVWDSGIGIPAEQQVQIFQPYHQLGTTLVDRSRGLGLGLAIVGSLGELLGHPVEVRSCIGRGSVFSITVPLAPTPRVVAASDGPALAASAPTSPGAAALILLIDDDDDVLQPLGQLLRDEGHAVMAVRDEAQALAALADAVPDLVISDFRLAAGRDGLELAGALRAAVGPVNGRLLPVIMLTGDISIEALLRFAAHDIVRLSKPVRPALLRAEIAAALRHVPPDTKTPAITAHASTAGSDFASAVAGRLVHVIDDNAGVRHELGTALADAGMTVRLHPSSEAFRAHRDPHDPDVLPAVLVVDAVLPGESGIELLRHLAAEGPLPPAIIITGHGDVAMAVAAMQAGARDFIEKPASGAAIIASIGRALASPATAGHPSAEQAAAAARLSGLTPRQREVMVRVLNGHPSKNIAADLALSQRTVENHRAQIMHRTSCRSLPELARLVMVADPGGVTRV